MISVYNPAPWPLADDVTEDEMREEVAHGLSMLILWQLIGLKLGGTIVLYAAPGWKRWLNPDRPATAADPPEGREAPTP